jgi:hypothetical protein
VEVTSTEFIALIAISTPTLSCVGREIAHREQQLRCCGRCFVKQAALASEPGHKIDRNNPTCFRNNPSCLSGYEL